ncbi:MAG: HDIG domain-containing metalloprotein [Candidatus Thermoplasmatota archaeon]
MTDAKARPVKVPSAEECLRILAQSGCSESVQQHCVAVARLAVKIARRCGADVELVQAGALLHDLGRCKTHGMAHAVEGARMAADMKLPPALVKIIERHIGGGITRAEAAKLGLPKKDFVPRTLEEKVVAHADNLTAGARRVSIGETLSGLVRRRMSEPAEQILHLHRELSEVCGCDVDEIP